MSSEESIESAPNPMFTETYSCVLLVNQCNRQIERGGKLILPVSALEVINNLDISYPLMFKVTNKSSNKFTHAGVLEFTAEEGQVSIPQWMFSHLELQPGDNVTLETTSLPSGTHCSIEALTRNFAYVSDTRQLLENTLKYFSCLTEGDTFSIHDNSCSPNQIYKVRISQTRPESAVNIFECDLEVDYSVPAPKVSNSKLDEDNKRSAGIGMFQGTGHRLDGGTVGSSTTQKPCTTKRSFIAFDGTGNVLQKGKRKAENNDSNSPPGKKIKKESDGTTHRPNELIFIRDQQRNYLRKQNTENKRFPGQGHSLKDN